MSRADYPHWEMTDAGFDFWAAWMESINFWAGPACDLPEWRWR